MSEVHVYSSAQTVESLERGGEAQWNEVPTKAELQYQAVYSAAIKSIKKLVYFYGTEMLDSVVKQFRSISCLRLKSDK
jgi:hypothetical protein